WSVHPVDIICFTHYHGDHISGLPGLLLSMGNADRREPVTMIGPKGLEKVVTALRVIAPELPFSIQFIEIEENVQEFHINDYRIKAFKVNHNVLCYGYSIEVERAGRFLSEKAQENQVPKQAWNRLQKGETVEIDGKVYTQDMVLGAKRKGIKLIYCTDTRPTKSLVENAENADLLICEGMYGEKEKAAKAREYKHMTFYEAAEVAKKAKVQELWLTHFSPSLVRPEIYLKDTKKIFEKTEIGKDGKNRMLEFLKEE
ncbi:MAG: ribonuclease Z, partial [Acetivibrio sp.]